MCVRRKKSEPAGNSARNDAPTALPPPPTTRITNPEPWRYSIVVRPSLVHCWDFPHSLSQSRFGGRQTPSSACTIISLTVAKLLHCNDVRLPVMQIRDQRMLIPEALVEVLANGIVDGNAYHRKAMSDRAAIWRLFTRHGSMFTIPAAIDAMGGNMHEIDFRMDARMCPENLCHNISEALFNEATQSLQIVYFVLICVERAVMMMADRRSKTIILIDSHSHLFGIRGGQMIMAPFRALDEFCIEVCKKIFPEAKSTKFEISCLHYRPKKRDPMKERLSKINAKVFPRNSSLRPIVEESQLQKVI